ncbi:hypothetical protein ACTFIR_003828 [Dictyostelium discoideum]
MIASLCRFEIFTFLSKIFYSSNKAYLHVLVDPQYRDLFRFVWKGSHYRWKTMPFGLSTAPRIFTILLRPVLRMLRDINVSVIAYLDDLLIVGSTKEECLSNLKKTMDLLVKLGFKLNLEKSVLEPTQSITFLGLQIDSVSMKLLVPKEKKKSIIKEIRNFLKLDCCSPRKLDSLKGKLIALKDAVIPFRLYTRQDVIHNTVYLFSLRMEIGINHSPCPSMMFKSSRVSHWLTVLLLDYVLTTDASESGAGATLKKGNKTIKTWSFQWSTTQLNMSSNRREMLALLYDDFPKSPVNRLLTSSRSMRTIFIKPPIVTIGIFRCSTLLNPVSIIYRAS